LDAKKTINLFVSIFKGSDSAASLSLDDLDDSLIVDSQLVNQSAPITYSYLPIQRASAPFGWHQYSYNYG